MTKKTSKKTENETKAVRVDVLQNLTSLKEKAKKLKLTMNIPTLEETSVNLQQSEHSMEWEENERKLIAEEWEKIEVERMEINLEKEKILKLKTALSLEKSELEEERKQLDLDWGHLQKMKNEILKNSQAQSLKSSYESLNSKTPGLVGVDQENDLTLVEDLGYSTPKAKTSLTPQRRSLRKRKTEDMKETKSKIARTAERLPRLRLRDIATLTETAEVSLNEADEIIEVSDEEEEKDDEDHELELQKFQRDVSELLKKLYNRNPQILSDQQDAGNLLSLLGKKFYEDFLESHKRFHGTSRGILLTRELERNIFDRFFLFLEIKMTVNHHLKKHFVYGTKKFHVQSTELSMEFLDYIMESKRIMDRTLPIKKLSGDNKLWIANQIKFKLSD